MAESDRVEDARGPTGRQPWPAQERQRAAADITELAVAAVPGCTAAALMLTADAETSTVAATGWAARAVDDAQHHHGEGPCLTAVRTGAVVLVEDYTAEHRWPAVVREAAAVGVGGSLSVPLVDDGRVLGALNLYASAAGAFDVPSRRTAAALARQGAAGLHLRQRRADVPQRPAEPGAARSARVDAPAAPDAPPSAPGAGAATDPAELARHLALLLARAEQDCRRLWEQLRDEPAGRTASARNRAGRCLSLVQDALLLGAVDLAADLGVPEVRLPA